MNLPKSIKSYQLMGESSYANSVLQAFIQLQCVQEWIKQLNNSGAINMQYYNTTLTKGIYFLFCNLPSGMLDSSQIIQNFETKSQGIWNKYITKDPYHFLFYFLDILHFENNMPKNPNFNMNSYNQSLANNIHSDENTFKLFANYIDQTQNSFISNYFNGIQKYMITCPNCQIMYNYGFKKIFRFNLDEILILRNQSYPLKVGSPVSLNECFLYSFNRKQCQCQLCANIFTSEYQKIYQAPNVLIIAFNRMNHTYNYQCDVKFYNPNFDISNFLINSNSENRKYILKAVISCYGFDKYFTDVLINGCFYRIMDVKTGQDVKMINVNQLFKYQPMLLIYEVDYQNQLLERLKQIQIFIWTKNLEFMMMRNQNLSVNNQGNQMFNNDINNSTIFINLKFQVIPENWDGSEVGTFPINPQVTLDSTVQYAIDKFYTKLQKPKEAINRFTFNNMVLDINSQVKLKDLQINSNSVIYAIKNPNFDQIKFE